jgi:hypothetical protein
MKNLLSEELERYRTLSNYNTKFTLTENTEIFSENIILNEQPGVSLSAAKTAFKNLGMKLTKFTKMEASQLTKVLAMDERTFAKELTKAMNKDIKAGQTTMVAAKELSKIQVIREITRQKPTTVAQVDDIITSVKNQNKLQYSNLRANKSAGTGTKTAPGPGGNKQKAGGVAAANPSLVAKIKAGMPWKTLLKVGAGIATVGVLWWLFTDNSPLPQPTSTPPEPTPTPPNPYPPTPSKYKTCPDTFPIAMYCKNETVRKVQGCLSIKTDGAFGTGTQSALVAKGLPGTEITQNTVDVACGSKVVEPVVDPNVDLIDGEDATKL